MQSVKLDLTKWECYHRANVAEINEGVWLALSSTARTWPLRRTSLWFLGSVSFSSFKELQGFQQPESIWPGMSHTFLHGWQLRGCSSDVIWAPAKVSELIQKHTETKATLVKRGGGLGAVSTWSSSKTAKHGPAHFLTFSWDPVCSKNVKVQFDARLCEG